MNSAHDIIRARLLRGTEPPPRLCVAELRASEWSAEFERLMRNRMVMGAFRYGAINTPGKPRFDRVEYIVTKVKRYRTTGNLEALVDIANLAMLEFIEGAHPLRHFSALDDTAEHARTR